MTGAQEQSLTYNKVGDILTNTGVQGFGEEEPGRTYAWDSDNRLTSVSVQSAPPYKPSVWNFLYDSEGGRIEKSGPDGTIQYFGLAEVVDGKLVQYYFAGAMLVARKAVDEGGAKTFYHADRLGSTRVMTDESGNKVKDYEYASFGQTLAQSGTADNEIGFTGHRTDAGTGLIYMGARYYDPQLSRLISPDTVLPDVYNPQALNRYAYAYNNPVNNTDPSGHAPVAVAAVSYAITMAATTTTTVMVTATIGFGLSVAGYCLKNPYLSVIGGIMTGFSGGYAMSGAAGWSSTAQVANGIMGAAASALSSPLSPLDAQSRQIVGWAWTAYGVAVSVSNMFGNDYVKAAGADRNVQVREGKSVGLSAQTKKQEMLQEVVGKSRARTAKIQKAIDRGQLTRVSGRDFGVADDLGANYVGLFDGEFNCFTDNGEVPGIWISPDELKNGIQSSVQANIFCWRAWICVPKEPQLVPHDFNPHYIPRWKMGVMIHNGGGGLESGDRCFTPNPGLME